ncbi:MAG: hypothetical protein QOG28_6104 [Trebonia sp.]|nr:hypothetical protein [Trebonia sp.]
MRRASWWSHWAGWARPFTARASVLDPDSLLAKYVHAPELPVIHKSSPSVLHCEERIIMRIGMRLGPFHVSTSTRRRRRPPVRRQVPSRTSPRGGGGGNRNVPAIAGGGLVLLLIIIGVAVGCGKGTPTGNVSPITTTTPMASSVGSAAAIVASAQPTTTKTQPAKTKTTTTAKPTATKTQPARTQTAVAPTQAAAPPAPAKTTPVAVPAPPVATARASCSPLTNGGNCYEPGEFCRNSDHGASGVAGDGKAITCDDNDGWRWEPS